MAQKKQKLTGPPNTGKISYAELHNEIVKVLEALTHWKGITKDEHLHAVPRLGIMTTAASQGVAATLNARPKIRAANLVVTTNDVGTSDTVLELQTLCWGKIPSPNKK